MPKKRSTSKTFGSTKVPKGVRRAKASPVRKVPFRDINRDGVTYSFLSEWLLDREQARLSYVEGWGTSGLSTPLDFGSAFHDCLEWVAAGKRVDLVGRAIDDYRVRRHKYAQPKLSPKEKELLDIILQSALVTFLEYEEYWRQTDKGMTWVLQEESFKHQHVLPSGRGIWIRGRWDAVIQDKDGSHWIWENKTKGQVDEEGIVAALPQDMQTQLYSYVYYLHTGIMPKGVVYNVIRRPGLRQKKDESNGQYLERIRKDIQERRDWYFFRWRVEFSAADVHKWVDRTLNKVLEQVVTWWDSIADDPFDPWDSPHHFVNPDALFTRYGRSQYFDLLTRGRTTGLYQR